MIINRTIHILFVAFTLLTISACGSDDGEVIAEIPFRQTFEIQAGLNTIEDHFFVFKDVVNPTMEILASHGIAGGDIMAIKPKLARMTVQFDNTPLSFIHEVSISLFSDHVGRKSEAFWTPQVSFKQNSILDVPATLIDAKDFLDQDEMNFELRLDTREVTLEFVTCRLDITFEVIGKK